MSFKCLVMLLALLLSITGVDAQVSEPNIDFELGNLSYWRFDTGHCCPLVFTGINVAPMPDRHQLVSGSATDPYGGFPIVSPHGGNYSLKLGNSDVWWKAEAAKYTVHVPAVATKYSVVFRYAVVFQNPGHDPPDQPRFVVTAIDSATGAPIECGVYTYVATSSLPGFHASVADTSVKYKDWTTASIDLSAYSGKTIIVRFATGDCGQGGHFGYGYIDADIGLFAVSTYSCASEVTLRGPGGYAFYYWYDAGFTTLIDTGQVITVSNGTPTGPKTYAVVFMPHPGYGCPDTLYTTIYPVPRVEDVIDIDCIGKDVLLTGPDSMSAYKWYDAAYNPLGTGRTLLLHDLPGPSTYPLVVVGDTALGCPDTLLVTVNPAIDPASAVSHEYCSSGAELAVDYNGAGFYWYDASGSLIGTGANIAVKNATAATTYMLVIKPDTGMMCNDTIYYIVPPRETDASYKISVLSCNAEQMTITGPAGYAAYTWYDASFAGIIGTTRTLEFKNPGVDKEFVLLTRALTHAECYDTLRAVINHSELLPLRQPDQHVCKGKAVQLRADVTGNKGALTYEWQPAGFVECAGCAYTTTLADNDATYTVTVKDEAGCTVADTIRVTLDTCVLVLPNAFTPNADGRNDVFRVTGAGFENFSSFSFAVFNRFGEQVFVSTDMNAGWDGTFNNQKQDLGTYFYMVIYTLNDERHVLKGDVTLVR